MSSGMWKYPGGVSCFLLLLYVELTSIPNNIKGQSAQLKHVFPTQITNEL